MVFVLEITTKILVMLPLSSNFNYRSQVIPNDCSHSNCNSFDSGRLFIDEDNILILLLLGEVQLFYLYPSYGKLYSIIFFPEMWLTKVILKPLKRHVLIHGSTFIQLRASHL